MFKNTCLLHLDIKGMVLELTVCKQAVRWRVQAGAGSWEIACEEVRKKALGKGEDDPCAVVTGVLGALELDDSLELP